jgi:hypothetical protein
MTTIDDSTTTRPRSSSTTSSNEIEEEIVIEEEIADSPSEIARKKENATQVKIFAAIWVVTVAITISAGVIM